MKTSEVSEKILRETEKIILGKRGTIELVLTAILSGGHVLLEDLPGSGKTTLVRTMALALGCRFRRIQFTPDLLPADITGMTVFNQKTSEFEEKPGPVYTNLLLADEINRAIPRTQSALLEAMEERQVTIDGVSHPLPDPFFVMATQNPVEKESTFSLPAAQMDRFFMRLSLGYPSDEDEIRMLVNLGDRIPFEEVNAAASPELLRELREEITGVYTDEICRRYIVNLVQATRSHDKLSGGASPRASRSLYQGSKTCAAMQGRAYVIPEDIQKLCLPVLSHRVRLTSEARVEGRTPEDILRGILARTPVPPEGGERFAYET